MRGTVRRRVCVPHVPARSMQSHAIVVSSKIVQARSLFPLQNASIWLWLMIERCGVAISTERSAAKTIACMHATIGPHSATIVWLR